MHRFRMTTSACTLGLALYAISLVFLWETGGVLVAQEGTPTELLTSLERPVSARRGDKRYTKTVLAAYDPTTGQRRELAVQEHAIVPEEERRSITVASGDSLLVVVSRPTPSVIRVRGDQRTENPLPMFTDLERTIGRSHIVRVLEPSLDGRGWVMLVGDAGVVMHHEHTTRAFDLKWIDWEGGTGMHDAAFSWSPDSRKVAFYYAYAEGMRASPEDRDFGIALVTLDDGVVELVKPSGRTTAWLGDEAWPPQWSSDSRYVYFIQGPLPGEKVPPEVYPAFTYRVDIRTGQEEKLIQGVVASVAPDDSYLLLNQHCVPTQQGNVEPRTAKLDLRTQKSEVLPVLLAGSPRISPSGRYVAGICRDKDQAVVRFFDPSDWSVISDAGPMRCVGSAPEWAAFCRWITLEAPPQPAVPTTQP